MTLIYSFVARGTSVLAEYTAFSGNFSQVATECLQKAPDGNNKFTYTCDGHTFNFLTEGGFSKFMIVYMCIFVVLVLHLRRIYQSFCLVRILVIQSLFFLIAS